MNATSPKSRKKGATSIDDGICSLSDFLVFDPVVNVGLVLPWKCQGKTHHLFCRSALALSTASMRRTEVRLGNSLDLKAVARAALQQSTQEQVAHKVWSEAVCNHKRVRVAGTIR